MTYGRHLRDGEVLGRPDDEVDAQTKDSRQHAVDPECHAHGVQQPWPGVDRPVLGDVDQDGAEGDDAGGDEPVLKVIQKSAMAIE